MKPPFLLSSIINGCSSYINILTAHVVRTKSGSTHSLASGSLREAGLAPAGVARGERRRAGLALLGGRVVDGFLVSDGGLVRQGPRVWDAPLSVVLANGPSSNAEDLVLWESRVGLQGGTPDRRLCSSTGGPKDPGGQQQRDPQNHRP